MKAADGRVLYLLWEGLSAVVTEATAFGLPIASKCVGGAVLVEDDTTGVSVSPGDLDAIAALMQRVGRMPPEELAAWAACGRQRVRQLRDRERRTRRTTTEVVAVQGPHHG